MSISREWLHAVVCTGLLAGCATDPADFDDADTSETTAAITAVGDPLPGITAVDFEEAKAAFVAVEALEDGVGPIFNERACGNCHTQGGIGGAGVQIERRFGTFANGRFNPLDNRGGSLRQLFTAGPFTGLNGERCNPPLEVEPREATVRNVGRQTTPLFGLGLVDALPDSLFDGLAAAQPREIRGTANRVRILLPNVGDTAQRVNGTRVGRFGWKAGISTLTEFSADAYVNEMAITTQHCVRGASVTTFAAESRPNGVASPAGCDDLAPPQPAGNGVPAGTDDAVGSCAGGLTEIQDDVHLFERFMTFLAPTPRLALDAAATRGQRLFNDAGCNGCHVTTTFRTPSAPANGVPGNFAFTPFSDFLVHDMGDGGDFIGNPGDSVAVTRRMRTAPLWGIRFRTQLMHDGHATSIQQATRDHQGQGQRAADAFNRLTPAQQNDLTAFVRTL